MLLTKQWNSEGNTLALLTHVATTVWRNPIDHAVWITTGTTEGQRFLLFEVAYSQRERSRPGAQTPDDSPASVCLMLSSELFRDTALMGTFDDASRQFVADPLAYELAFALDEISSQCEINPYSQGCLVNMLCAVLAEACSSRAAHASRNGGGFEPWQCKRMNEAFSEMWKGKMSLQHFAARCGLSVCHFARLFKMTYGTSFHQYIVRRRLERACELLTATEESVSQIALECGFSDQSSFTRRFSAKVGTSPAAWRRAWSQRPGAFEARHEVQLMWPDSSAAEGGADELDCAA